LGVYLDEDFSVRNQWVGIRPVPEGGHWFEDVWNKYMRDEIVDPPN
jgi:hypothetical protein